jgi:hypothetical protein
MMGRRKSPHSERSKMPDRKMRGGALLVKTRTVPGYAYLQVSAQFKQPDAPKVKIQSVAGHYELKDAPTDSPEWAEYARQVQEVEQQIKDARSDFIYDYAIEAWSWDDGENWCTDEPHNWLFPSVLLRHGIQPSNNSRVDYIRYDLITDNEDVAIMFQDALGSAAAITDAEVSAASAGFWSNIQRWAATRGKAKRD